MAATQCVRGYVRRFEGKRCVARSFIAWAAPLAGLFHWVMSFTQDARL